MESLTNSLKEFNSNISSIKAFFENPFQCILNYMISISKPVCLTGAIISVILYILGFDKYAKYTGLFCLLFVILQCLRMVQ